MEIRELARLRQLGRRPPRVRYGYKRLHTLRRREGWQIHKRVMGYITRLEFAAENEEEAYSAARTDSLANDDTVSHGRTPKCSTPLQSRIYESKLD